MRACVRTCVLLFRVGDCLCGVCLRGREREECVRVREWSKGGTGETNGSVNAVRGVRAYRQ